MSVQSNRCPVCGYDLGFPAWVEDSPSDEICPSCGIQFGYQDSSGTDRDWRKARWADWRRNWIQQGMPWDKGRSAAPPGWDPVKQLQTIGVDVRQEDSRT